MALKTADDMKAHVLDKAAADSQFRAELLADPKAAIERELSVTVPDGFTIRVLEDEPTTVHLVLPLPPQELELADLQNATGGSESAR